MGFRLVFCSFDLAGRKKMGNSNSAPNNKKQKGLPRSQSSKAGFGIAASKLADPKGSSRKASEPVKNVTNSPAHNSYTLNVPGDLPTRKKSGSVRSARSSIAEVSADRKTSEFDGPSASSGLKPSQGFRRTKSICYIPKSPSGNVRNASPSECSLKLTMAQMHLVRKAWHQARSKGMCEPGLTIFRNLSFKSPEIREMFANGTNERFHESIKEHAKVFTDLMDQLIANLERNEIMTLTLIEVGKKHINVASARRNFKSLHMDAFASAMIERTLEWGEKAQRNEFSQTAWTKIVLFFVEKIKDGFLEESKRTRRERRKQSMVPAIKTHDVVVTITDDQGSETAADHHEQ